MAKLNQFARNAGFNAGDSYVVSYKNISGVVIDPEISRIFKVQEKIRDEIAENIKQFGFDKSQPLTIQKGTDILLDGHTRLAAAIKAGLEEVPVIEKEFEDREDALFYTFERQAVRRNLTGAEIMRAVELLPEGRNENGLGRKAKQLAERLGVSPATIYQAQAVLKNASEEDKEAVKNGEMSIKAAYTKTAVAKKESEPKTERPAPASAAPETNIPTPVTAAHETSGSPEKDHFLLRAVKFLYGQNQRKAAYLLLHDFLPETHEREDLLNLLSKPVREGIVIW